MTDIPSFLNRVDFWAILLPGYIMIILSLLIFAPIIFVEKTLNSSFDLFSAVVFVVAGPAVGFTLQQIVIMISRIWGRLRGHRESNALRQNWNRLRLDSKGTTDEITTLDSMNSNYTFGINTATALFMILLGYILYLIIFPASADYQYKTVFSDLTNSTTSTDSSNSQTNSPLAETLRNSVSYMVAFSIFAVASLLAVFSKIEYKQVQFPLMVKLFREKNYCLYCSKKFDCKKQYVNHLNHHKKYYDENNNYENYEESKDIDDPPIDVIRDRMRKEEEFKKLKLKGAEAELEKIKYVYPTLESHLDRRMKDEMTILKQKLNENKDEFEKNIEKAKERLEAAATDKIKEASEQRQKNHTRIMT